MISVISTMNGDLLLGMNAWQCICFTILQISALIFMYSVFNTTIDCISKIICKGKVLKDENKRI